MSKVRSWGLIGVLVALAFTVAPPSAAAAPIPTPPGYKVVREEALAPGVHHVELVNDGGPQRLHVAVIDRKAGARVVPVLSSGRVSGPAPRLERTSSMCARVRCVVAVNADFSHRHNDESVGAFASGGELQRSPVPTHHQLGFDAAGGVFTGAVTSTVRVVSSDLAELSTPQLNVARSDNTLVLFTPAYGKTTATNAHGAELVGRVVRPKSPLRIGQTALVELVALRDGAGDTEIPGNGVVLSGHGSAADALRQLWRNVEAGTVARQVLVRVDTTPALTDTVGGVPVLVRNGQRFLADDATQFARGRHPRTLVGWTTAGSLLLVTADGRQPGHAAGLTLLEAADVMIGLGALEAINLDGGGSTTFVARGQVVNRPSDQLVARGGAEELVSLVAAGDRVLAAVERPTVSALTIVVEPPANPERDDAPVTFDADLPVSTLDLPTPAAADPASYPDGALPAIVRRVAADDDTPGALRWLAAALMASVAMATVSRVATARRCSSTDEV